MAACNVPKAGAQGAAKPACGCAGARLYFYAAARHVLHNAARLQAQFPAVPSGRGQPRLREVWFAFCVLTCFFLDRVPQPLRAHMIASHADKAIAKIAELKAGILLRRQSSRNVLRASQNLVKECGQAIARWFGSLSGPALEAAILESFKKFDSDNSGSIDRCARAPF